MSSFKRRASVAVACAIPVVVLAWPTSFAGAHGIGGRSDLPLPVWQVAWDAGVAVVLSFAILGLAWTKPRLVRLAVGRPLPRLPKPLAVFVGATTRVVGVAVLALTIAAGIAGDDSGAANFAPVALYVVLWVGVAFLCGLVGDLWPAFNPLATMATLLERRRAPRNTSARVPTAALGLLAFAWLELCYHDSVSPRVVGWAVAAYVLVVAGAVAMFGKAWLDGGEAFTTYFGLLGRIGPVGRDSEGRLRLRMPLSGLSTLEASPAVLWLVIVALGSTAFDGFSRLRWWDELLGNRAGWSRTLVQTIGLLWVIATVAAVYVGACRVSARLSGAETIDVGHQDLAERFAPSLVPIALAYAVAHYFSLLVFEGQNAIVQLSDPWGKGWNLFGTADWRVNFALVSTRTIAYVQALSIVIGHVGGVIVAHDRAVEGTSTSAALRSQYPLLVVMVAYTVAGLLLLFGA